MRLSDKQEVKVNGSTSLDLSASFTSEALTMVGDNIAAFAYFIDWTGSPNGEFSFEGSIDGSNWFEIVTAADLPENPGGSASQTGDVVSACPVNWVRLKYTSTSGSGTATAHIGAKAQI